MIGDKLKEIREETGMNKKEFASFIGIKYTTYNNYETGEREPNSDVLILISQKFDVSIDFILGLQDEKEFKHSYELKASEYNHIKKYRGLDKEGRIHVNTVMDWETERIKKLSKQQKQTIKTEKKAPALRVIQYYQKLASAGKGEYLFDDIPADTIKVKDTPVSRKADFVIGVNGDSMEPGYHDGEKVFVEKTASLETGEVGIFVQGENCFIKELGKNGLISRNKKYPMITPSEDIRVVGRVLGKVEENI